MYDKVFIYNFQVHLISTTIQNIPSLLKRIGVGLVVGSLLDLTLDTVGHINSNNTQCMFDTHHPGSANTLPIPLYWPLISDITIGVGAVIVACSFIEFVMAQTPNRMRGFMMGMAYTLLGIGYLVHQGLQLLIGHFNKAMPSCGFYYYVPGAINPSNTVNSTVHHCCQAIQAEREGEACQHTGHSRGAL